MDHVVDGTSVKHESDCGASADASCGNKRRPVSRGIHGNIRDGSSYSSYPWTPIAGTHAVSAVSGIGLYIEHYQVTAAAGERLLCAV